MAFRSTSAKHSDSSSSDDADSDDQREVHWKRVRKNTDLPDLVPVSDDKNVTRSNNISAGGSNKQRKVNSIWADVHSEQILSQTMSDRIAVSVNKHNTVRRGPETYDRSIAANRNFAAKSDVLQNLDEDLDSFVSSSKANDDLFDNVYLEPSEPLAPRRDVEKPRQNFRKRRHDDDRFKSKQRINRDKNIVQTQSMKFGVTFDKSESVEKLGAQMSSALNEIKSDLIIRCLKILGIDKCLEFYNATEHIEKNGGMLTLDKRRRRTPGGVLLQLIRDDLNVSEDSKKLLFLQERENQRKIEHAKRKIKRRKGFDELLQETKAKLGEKELRDKKDVFATTTSDEKSEMCEDGEVLSNDELTMQ